MYFLSITLIASSLLGEVAQGMVLGGDLEARGSRRRKNRKVMATALTCTPVDNPDSICGVRGTLDYYHPGELAGDSIAPDLATCRQYCGNRIITGVRSDGDCASFSYDTSSGLCSLYIRRHEEQSLQRDASSSIVHYDSDCFTCTPFCPQGNGKDNHIENGGFELSDEYGGPWYPKSYGGRVVSSGGLDSPNAYYCPAGEYLNCDLLQHRNLCIGQIYTITANFRYAPPAAGEPHPSVFVETDELFSSLALDDSFEPGVWYPLKYTFQAKLRDGDLPFVQLSTWPSLVRNVGSSNGSSRPGIYFDNVVVTPEPDNYTTQGSELVPNGGFESGNLGPWEYSWRAPSMGEISNPDAREGTAEVVSPGLTPQSSSAFRYSGGFLGTVVIRSGKFNMVAGEKYLFSYDYHVSQFYNYTYIECLNNDNLQEWVTIFHVGEESGDALKNFNRVVTAGGTSPCNVRLQFFTTNNYDFTNSVANVDNVRVTRLV